LELKAPLGNPCHTEHVKAQVREVLAIFFLIMETFVFYLCLLTYAQHTATGYICVNLCAFEKV